MIKIDEQKVKLDRSLVENYKMTLYVSFMVSAHVIDFRIIKYKKHMSTLHYQGELDNQPRNHLNQVNVHSAHLKPFQLQKWPIRYGSKP